MRKDGRFKREFVGIWLESYSASAVVRHFQRFGTFASLNNLTTVEARLIARCFQLPPLPSRPD